MAETLTVQRDGDALKYGRWFCEMEDLDNPLFAKFHFFFDFQEGLGPQPFGTCNDDGIEFVGCLLGTYNRSAASKGQPPFGVFVELEALLKAVAEVAEQASDAYWNSPADEPAHDEAAADK
jgi:hypothetical protein